MLDLIVMILVAGLLLIESWLVWRVLHWNDETTPPEVGTDTGTGAGNEQ